MVIFFATKTNNGNDVYSSIEEKASNFLYLIVKNHVFIYFLNFYDRLYIDGRKVIDNNALAALTLLVA